MFTEPVILVFIATAPLFLSLWAIVLLSDFSGNRPILDGWRTAFMISLVFLLTLGGIWVGFFEHLSWHRETWRSWLLYLISASVLVGYWKATRGKIAVTQSRKEVSQ